METEWSRDFVLCQRSQNEVGWRHCVGYNMFFLIDRPYPEWYFEHTTNPDLDGDGRRDGPYEPGDSDSAVVADVNTDFRTGGCGNWDKPIWAAHLDNISRRGCIAPPDSDVLFGDGHVTMATKLKYYYLRGHAGGTYAY